METKQIKSPEKLLKNSKKIVKRNKKGQLEKGTILNPEGRPLGSKNFETDFDEAVDEIAKANNMTRSEARKILLKKAFAEAKEGNFPFYKDIHDRIYGKAQDNVKIENPAQVEAIKSLEEIIKKIRK